MNDHAGQRAQQYLLDGTDEDLRRLVNISDVLAPSARTALLRAGLAPGWSAIECGCGPLGALPALADIVGPHGRVVGVDMNEPTVRRARSAIASLGLDNVRVFAADVNSLDAATAGGPYDLAYTRLFLMHQLDAAHTLRQIASLLRPGGLIVAMEPLRTPVPRALPHNDDVGPMWTLITGMVQATGACADAENLAAAAAAAGLEVVRVDGSFVVDDSATVFEIYAETLFHARGRGVAAGLVTPEQIDPLIESMRAAAASDGYAWVTSPYFLDLTLRKPG